MENRDTSVNEMIAQHELINKLLKDMDTKYPRRDKKSRKILRRRAFLERKIRQRGFRGL